MNRTSLFGLLLIALISVWMQPSVSAQELLLENIERIEKKTGYRFLYREALIRDLRIDLDFSEKPEQILSRLSSQLEQASVGIKIDSLRKQALLYKLNKQIQRQDINISGLILDAQSGERLPFATVAWKTGGVQKGIAASQSGSFLIETETSEQELTLLFSYLGYEAETVNLDLRNQKSLEGLAIRLQPDEVVSSEIIINAINYYTPRDTAYSGLVRNGLFNPLGESNAIRALQMLPSVQTSTAINEGLNIRGSSADGFMVQLDGVPIYNQSHLFGLLDSFNSDVLQSSGFYYDITPAQVSAPLGGTLSLITKTGSLNKFNLSTGISNTSYRATADGPLIRGKASFLLSGRISYMNELNWFNNSDLIEWGLDVDRPQSEIENERNLEETGLQTGEYSARFYDVHAKLNLENDDGSRVLLSFYSGADNTQQDYIRCLNTISRRPCTRTNPRLNNALVDLGTINDWGSNAVSLQYQKPISSNLFAQTSAGFTSYDLYYAKDDFAFSSGDGNVADFYLLPLIIENALNQVQFSQTFDATLDKVNMTNGAEFMYYEVDYKENSLERLNLLDQNSSAQLDLFNQLDFTRNPTFSLHLGNRIHYFTEGSYLLWSPRYKLQLLQDRPVSFSVGYSRNYQFLNRVQFSNANTADVWILANDTQEPSSVNQLTGGIYFKVGKYSFFQVEGYLKDHENIRLHELSTVFLNLNLQNDSPFLSDTQGFGRGLEFMFRTVYRKLDFTTAYTLSRMELENEAVNNGDSFDAEWDRRHQLNVATGYQLTPVFGVNASYIFATGTPNGVFAAEDRLNQASGNTLPEERLSNYSRVDISLNVQARNAGRIVFEGNLFLFNLFNNDNVWYREISLAVDDSQRLGNRLQAVPVDVYDLGFQPSFNMIFYF